MRFWLTPSLRSSSSPLQPYLNLFTCESWTSTSAASLWILCCIVCHRQKKNNESNRPKMQVIVKYKWLCIRLNNAGIDPLTEDADLGKKNHLFRWIHFDLGGYVNKAILSHLGHRQPARIHWKVDAPKTSHCLVRILVQRHNWTIFLRKCARRGCYSQWRSL